MNKLSFFFFSFFYFFFSLLLVVIVLPEIAVAKDFGKRGHNFQIKEESFLSMIERKLKKLDLDQEQAKMQKIAKDRFENPKAPRHIKPAEKGRKFYFDPTYTLKIDIVLPCGKIMHKRGTKVNPLDYMNLDRKMFFIDGNNKTQIEWIKTQLENDKENVPRVSESQKEKKKEENRIVLISGNILKFKEEVGKKEEEKVFFDQFGELTKKFGIKASPALVVQEGKLLKIEEIFLDT